MKLRANALHQTGRQRHSVIDRHQADENTFRTFGGEAFLFYGCLSVSRSSRLAADSSR